MVIFHFKTNCFLRGIGRGRGRGRSRDPWRGDHRAETVQEKTEKQGLTMAYGRYNYIVYGVYKFYERTDK